jgi:hypothetical protein
MSSLSSLSVGRSEPANSSGVETFSLDETADHVHHSPPLEEQEEERYHMNYGIAIGKKFVYRCCHTAKKNIIYVFLFWELRGLSPNFHILVSVSDSYIPRIGQHISFSRIGRPILEIYKSLTDI